LVVVTDERREALRREIFEELDLGPIMVKLIDPEEGEGWSREKVLGLSEEYRRYLYLIGIHPDEVIVPNKAWDEFWHYHILDTIKYAEDCERIFGFFLHHFPYFGMRGEEDRRNLENAFQNTVRLYVEEFGHEPEVDSSSSQCYKCGAPTCYSRCSADPPKVNQFEARPVFV
jgi:hypothetical protein